MTLLLVLCVTYIVGWALSRMWAILDWHLGQVEHSPAITEALPMPVRGQRVAYVPVWTLYPLLC